MGASSSKDDKLASVPVRFGEPGEVGMLLGVYHDHNLTSTARSDRRNNIVTVSRECIDVFNPISGDRRIRLRPAAPVTSCAYGHRSAMGPVVIVGTSKGEATIYELLTCTPFKDVRTVEINVAPASRTGLFPTAIVCGPTMASESSGMVDEADVFYVGNSDGSVASFNVQHGTLAKSYNIPETETLDATSDRSGISKEVVSLAVMVTHARPVLAVAHLNGDLHTFDAKQGQWLSHVRVAPDVTGIVAAPSFNTMLVSHEDSNVLVLWDLDSDQTLKLDFTQELNAVGKRKAKMTVVDFDDARSVIFAGASDGSVFVRKLDRSPTGAFGVKLLRYCNPSRNATTPSRLTSMYYDPETDRMHTGDMSGLARLVKKVTGVPYEVTGKGEEAVKAGRYRVRTGSFSVPAAGAGASAAGAEEAPRPAPALPEQWTLEWEQGTVTMSALGGMVVPKFVVAGGQQVSPLFVAPWSRDPESAKLPPILRALRGEYSCVPFGAARPVVGLTPEWSACKHEESEGPHSGYAANSTWTLESRTATSMVAVCEYPGHHVVKLVRKHVSVAGGSITVRTEVECRSAVSIPVGTSVMFSVSPRMGSTTLAPGGFEFGSVFPGTVEPGGQPTFALSPGASFDSLRAVPRRVPPGPAVDGDGADTPQDLSELPLADTQVEALVQLCGTDGVFHVVRHDLGCTFSLTWDPSVLPSAVVHVANNGRKYYPWSGAHSSVTVSPAASAFDLGSSVSSADNPLKSRGMVTAIDGDESAPIVMEYTLSVTKGTTPPEAPVRASAAPAATTTSLLDDDDDENL